MATAADFQKIVADIHKKWENPPARDGVFGNILKSVTLQNVRGITAKVEFTWPVTVIGGVNGSGKTTILQVCSAAYARAGGRYFKLGDWIRNALLGESPAVVHPAKAQFAFWNDTPTLEIPYVPVNTRWGYPRRDNPQRNVEFIGISEFAPRIERRDRVHASRASLVINKSQEMPAQLVSSLCTILGNPYTAASVNTVGTPKGKWEDELPQISRGAFIYGEPHMGAGEQKVFRLVRRLEAIPNKSLVLLEEPETTLHPDAQRGLSWYLMSLALRKGHQILVATHSPEMFDAMPEAGRVLLLRTAAGLQPVHGAPSLMAARELAGSVRTNRDVILVEDVVAKAFLNEVIRRCDRKLRDQCVIVPVGNTDDVRRMTEALRAQGIRAVGVRDGDMGGDGAGALFSLPGGAPPEAVLLAPTNIAATEPHIDGLGAACEIAKSRVIGVEPNKIAKTQLKLLADEIAVPPELLTDRLTVTWLVAHAAEAKELVSQIRAGLDKVQPGPGLGPPAAAPGGSQGPQPSGATAPSAKSATPQPAPVPAAGTPGKSTTTVA